MWNRWIRKISSTDLKLTFLTVLVVITAVCLWRERPRQLCVRPSETWKECGQSGSLPRTLSHIWCRRRSTVSSAGGQGARCGAVRAPRQETSRCRGPALKGGPSDTEAHTWGGQRSKCPWASPLSAGGTSVVRSRYPDPAEILRATRGNFMSERLKSHWREMNGSEVILWE